MRFGKWRGVSLAFAVAAVFGLGLASTVRADGWHIHPTLPGEVPAYDFTTGGEYFAPPVPYGHYAKDYVGGAAKGLGLFRGLLHGAGHGHGGGCGEGCGLGHGHGCGHGGDGSTTAARAAASAPAAGSFITAMAVAVHRGRRPSVGRGHRWRRSGHVATATGTRRTSLLATRRP